MWRAFQTVGCHRDVQPGDQPPRTRHRWFAACPVGLTCPRTALLVRSRARHTWLVPSRGGAVFLGCLILPPPLFADPEDLPAVTVDSCMFPAWSGHLCPTRDFRPMKAQVPGRSHRCALRSDADDFRLFPTGVGVGRLITVVGRATIQGDRQVDGDGQLQCRTCRKGYGPLQAVAGVSFTVRSGEVFALLGPNGAG